ncbi:hypothetical protein ACQ86N_02800 [Puia sp. P3]|uniref:hypothetical protein n=1 Tax=Puia sp. P3 TaxID=3423952 RepID=UPI003D6736AB
MSPTTKRKRCMTNIDSQKLTSVLENDSLSPGNKLFTLSDELSHLLWNNLENRIPSEFEKVEATLFACVWTMKILARKYPPLFDEFQKATVTGITENASIKVLTRMGEVGEREGESFLSIRLKFYIEQTNDMYSKGYSFGKLLYPLYVNPMSALSRDKSSDHDAGDFLKLMSIFTTGLKYYDKTINDIFQLLEQG